MFPSYIKNLAPYKPSARVEESEVESWTLLDWNESTVRLPDDVIATLVNSIQSGVGVRYSNANHLDILSKISNKYSISDQSLLLFNGSDSALKDSIISLGNDRPFYTIGPEYSQINTFIQSVNAQHLSFDFDNPFDINVEIFISKISPNSIVYLSNPNNPTGRLFTQDDISLIASRCSFLLLDEAYVEFAPFSCEQLVKKYNNIIIFRTFSKIYGLAGFRLGYAISAPENIAILSKIRNSKEINSFALIAANAILEDPSVLANRIDEVQYERNLFIEFINGFNGEIICYPSHGNFVVIKTPHLANLMIYLHANKILIRDRSSVLGMNNCARVTIGNKLSMNLLKKSIFDYFSLMSLNNHPHAFL